MLTVEEVKVIENNFVQFLKELREKLNNIEKEKVDKLLVDFEKLKSSTSSYAAKIQEARETLDELFAKLEKEIENKQKEKEKSYDKVISESKELWKI